MKRVLTALTLLGVIAGAVALSGAGGTTGGARVDAIFDSASFLIPGQDVKIAGARVGTVKDITLTEDHKARIEMEIDPAFVPFRGDADCTIQPQSLIGEKFIDCTPGTPRAPALIAQDGKAPTVPLANTHSPVDLDLVFATFRRPTNERLSILLSALGSGLAARGEDVNQVIRRANPALQETRRVLGIVADDRRNLTRLLAASDHVLETLAERRERISAFVTAADKVTATTAQRRRQLGDTVQTLPPLLTEAQPSLRALATVAREGTPVLRDLRAAAPQLRRLADDAPALTAAARPALTRLGTASAAGDTALRAAQPVVKKLRRFAAAAKPVAPLLNELFASLKQTGTVERLTTFTYNVALTVSRYDRISHLIPPYALVIPACGAYATASVSGCSAHFAGGQTTTRRRPTRAPARKAKPSAPPAATPAAPPAAQAPATPATPAKPGGTTIQIPGLPPITLPQLPVIDDVLGYLLR